MKEVLAITRILFILFFTGSIFAHDKKSSLKSDFADFNGTKIYYQEAGKGSQALIFVHGWACNSDFWRESVSAFPDRHVIALDLPGHGKSDKPQVAYRMNYFAQSIEAVMKSAKVERAVLVGHSLGTPVIRQFYRLHPKQTLGLVIVDGALHTYSDKKAMEALYNSLRADYKATARLIVDAMLQPVRDEKLKQEIRAAMLATPQHVGLSAMESLFEDALWEPDPINVPALAIMAESSGWKPGTEDFYKKLAPNIDLRVWQGASHFLMMEEPKLFNKSVALYLSKNKLL